MITNRTKTKFWLNGTQHPPAMGNCVCVKSKLTFEIEITLSQWMCFQRFEFFRPEKQSPKPSSCAASASLARCEVSIRKVTKTRAASWHDIDSRGDLRLTWVVLTMENEKEGETFFWHRQFTDLISFTVQHTHTKTTVEWICQFLCYSNL